MGAAAPVDFLGLLLWEKPPMSLPSGHPPTVHALAQPGASPFHDTVLLMLKLQNPVPAAPPGAAPPPAPPPGHDPFWRYIYYMH